MVTQFMQNQHLVRIHMPSFLNSIGSSINWSQYLLAITSVACDMPQVIGRKRETCLAWSIPRHWNQYYIHYWAPLMPSYEGRQYIKNNSGRNVPCNNETKRNHDCFYQALLNTNNTSISLVVDEICK